MGSYSIFGIICGPRRGLLPALALVAAWGLPMAQAGAQTRYNDWELWTSAANAVLPARGGDAGPFRVNVAVGGGAAHRPDKRWSNENYQDLARHLISGGITPVFIGGADELPLTLDLAKVDPMCLSLAGETTISDLFVLARNAKLAIGNDTGPMHAAAASGCKTVVLYSAASDPTLCAQRGEDVTIHRVDDLKELSIETVTQDLALAST